MKSTRVADRALPEIKITWRQPGDFWRKANTVMANFRAERLFIRVAGALDFDPNEGINAEEFAFAMVCDVDAYDRPTLQDYTFAPFERPRWFLASEGLTTVRALIAEAEAKLGSASPDQKTHLESTIAVLQVVEERLDLIDLKDYKFHFLARDLE